MLNQNIKIALLSMLGLVVFWLIIFGFIKIDISCPAVVTFVDNFSYVAIENDSASYIENKQIDYVKLQYEKQYFSCHITYSSSADTCKYYLISLPAIIDKTNNYLATNIIVDSLNVYQYLIKK